MQFSESMPGGQVEAAHADTISDVELVHAITAFLDQTRSNADTFAEWAHYQTPLESTEDGFREELAEGMKLVQELINDRQLVQAWWVCTDGRVDCGQFRGIRWDFDLETGLDLTLHVRAPHHEQNVTHTIQLPQLLSLNGVAVWPADK